MSREKLRIKNTQLDNLIANLRGEVGEVTSSWILLRRLIDMEAKLTSDDIAKDLADQNRVFVSMLTTKLADDIVARLSELAEPKIGRLTFHFAATKLGELNVEERAFRTYIVRKNFQKKRNLHISHKELPEKWTQHGSIFIP